VESAAASGSERHQGNVVSIRRRISKEAGAFPSVRLLSRYQSFGSRVPHNLSGRYCPANGECNRNGTLRAELEFGILDCPPVQTAD
jgi:hypothetical protein